MHIMVDFKVQELAMELTLMMKMTFVLANESKCIATSESPNLQTGVTNIHGHHISALYSA